MAIQIQGYSGVVAECDGPNHRSLRITVRPLDYGALGQYRCVMWVFPPPLAAGMAGNTEVYQLRWTATPQLAIIWGINLDGWFATTGFTPGFVSMTMTIARSWTVDGSGGTPADLTGNNQKLRTSMGTSLMGAIRVVQAASALTNGTKTLDAQPIAQVGFSVNASTNTNYLSQTCLYGASALEDGGNPAPIVLVQNEGLVVRATVPATGTWNFGITTAWSEVTAY